MKRYNPSAIESKWQAVWSDEQIYAAKDFDKRPKFVMLTEFPYPSGAGIHIGHMREYTVGDIIARWKRMTGHNVLFPMGFDAFGLPTENYAIKNQVSPQAATDTNTANIRRQLDMMGYSIDWNRSFSTADSEYYRWTQWIFLQFFQAGLAYQAEIAINWCPFCKTGLANEEVINGRHERCDNLVEKKLLKQWLLRITDYAERLIDGLKTVDYPSRIASQQINWIGRSEGAEIEFTVLANQSLPSRPSTKNIKKPSPQPKISVFTTRPDTIFGATFMVLAPEHPLVKKITTKSQKEAVETYVKSAAAKSDLERQENRHKTGVPTGAYALNPANDQLIPIWVADYVLMGYGTGAIMAVPAHDERDYQFATKFDLPVQQVVVPSIISPDEPPRHNKKNTKRQTVIAVVYNPKTDLYLTLKWPKFHWHNFVMGGIETDETAESTGRREVTEETGYHNLLYKGEMPLKINSQFYAPHKDVNRDMLATTVLFELEDETRIATKREAHEDFELAWVTRAELDKLTPVDELPWILDWLDGKPVCFIGQGLTINSGQFDGLKSEDMKHQVVKWLSDKGAAKPKVQYKLRDWIFSRQHYWGEPIPIIHCPVHQSVPVPENDLPVELPLIDHYQPTDNGQSPLSEIADWVDTTCPICGRPSKRETDTMPNWAGSSWYYLRYYDAHNNQQFASADKLQYWNEVDLYLGGMEHTTLHLLYSRFWHQFLYDRGLVPTPEPYAARRGQGIILAADGTKMSKSKGNVVDPTQVIDSGYGADATRLADTFLAPYDQTTPWSPEAVAGTYRFLNRFWNLAQAVQLSNRQTNSSRAAKTIVARTIKKVTDDLAKMNYNTAIAALMEAQNQLSRLSPAEISPGDLADLTQLLAPFAPHITEEIWRQTLGHTKSIHISAWPKYAEKYLVEDQISLAIQVNGKLRAEITVAADTPPTEIEQLALSESKVTKFIGQQKPSRVIYVPGKIVNIVV